ncbi:MAG: Serine/threonine protein kinase [Myxococcales bacterium]|nr:Serine/threonine protein kinase [Myxococcales bacterium]
MSGSEENPHPHPDRAPLKAGDRLGAYQLLQPIGSGGMGSVFEAVHAELGKRCAIKVLHDEYSHNSKIVRRFFNEARAVAKIRHENIIDVYDFGKTPDRYYYFVMELLEGSSLADELKRLGRIELKRACFVVGQIARALAAVHAAGIVHRDLKPGNLFLTRRAQVEDFVKVLDFGIAKLITKSHLEQTETGVVIGTTRYMAPEQCRGGKEVDHRADVYALGTVFYGMVAGRLPFTADNPGDLVVQHLTEVPPPLSYFYPGTLPPELEALAARALAKNPADRFQSMDELADVLVPFGGPERGLAPTVRDPMSGPPSVDLDLDDTPPMVPAVRTPAPDVSTETRPERQVTRPHPKLPGRGRAVAIGVAGVTLLAAVVGVAAVLRTRHRAPTPAPVTQPATAVVAPPAPRVADTVSILISSVPDDARVLLVGDDTPLGKTPFDWQAKRGTAPLRLRLVKDGFESVEQEVVPNADHRLSIMLRAVVTAPAPAKRRAGATKKPATPARNDGLLAPSY